MEDLNQNLTEETGLFDDVEETTEDTETVTDVEEAESKPTEAETTETTDPADGYLNVRYNKQDMRLSKEEAQAFAQKGMNYDALQSKYQSLHGNIEKLARMNGMDIDAFIGSLGDMQKGFLLNQELNTLKQSYPDADEQMLNELAKRRAEEKFASMEMDLKQQAQESQQVQKTDLALQLSKFEKRYPDIDASKLDQSVYDMMQEGYTLLEAYDYFKEQESARQQSLKEEKDKIISKNETNKDKSYGNIGSNEDVDVDPFLSGFLKD